LQNAVASMQSPIRAVQAPQPFPEGEPISPSPLVIANLGTLTPPSPFGTFPTLSTPGQYFPFRNAADTPISPEQTRHPY
jgi:hypothetical protein